MNNEKEIKNDIYDFKDIILNNEIYFKVKNSGYELINGVYKHYKFFFLIFFTLFGIFFLFLLFFFFIGIFFSFLEFF